MKINIKYILGVFFVLLLTTTSCTEETYSLGDLTAPSNIAITANLVGKDATHPDGDGSGDVNFTVTATNGIAYKIDYDANTPVDFVLLPNATGTKKYTKLGLNTYRVTAIVTGAGGTSSTITKEISVRSSFVPDAAIITNLTNNSSKTWIVDKSVAAHFGVGPWAVGSVRPEWWQAKVNEKVNCCNCFYTASFKFIKNGSSGTYSLEVATPDGAFVNTGGALAGGLPGIPSNKGEGCFDYPGGTSEFSFGPATSGVPVVPTGTNSTTTQTSINLAGVDTFIGYGSCSKEYEILTINSNKMYLRSQGTNPGNAWYLVLIPKP